MHGGGETTRTERLNWIFGRCDDEGGKMESKKLPEIPYSLLVACIHVFVRIQVNGRTTLYLRHSHTHTREYGRTPSIKYRDSISDPLTLLLHKFNTAFEWMFSRLLYPIHVLKNCRRHTIKTKRRRAGEISAAFLNEQWTLNTQIHHTFPLCCRRAAAVR